MNGRLKETKRQLQWRGLVLAVVFLITVSWILGWGKTGIGVAAVLVALWDARN